ncbi:hypothetical protein AcW2_005729 [Taiwanofungus camphoratus]|nr:hypothetical protein AcW2_005729 [Antrodia cinnamomea]
MNSYKDDLHPLTVSVLHIMNVDHIHFWNGPSTSWFSTTNPIVQIERDRDLSPQFGEDVAFHAQEYVIFESRKHRGPCQDCYFTPV